MIRNKRTTYAACIGMANPLAIQRTIPRLAAPIPSDDVPFAIDTDSYESLRQREASPSRNLSRTSPR
jgi:hypothetical protein